MQAGSTAKLLSATDGFWHVAEWEWHAGYWSVVARRDPWIQCTGAMLVAILQFVHLAEHSLVIILAPQGAQRSPLRAVVVDHITRLHLPHSMSASLRLMRGADGGHVPPVGRLLQAKCAQHMYISAQECTWSAVQKSELWQWPHHIHLVAGSAADHLKHGLDIIGLQRAKGISTSPELQNPKPAG